MRARPMTMPSATGTAPPERPVPAPRATNGAPWVRHTRTAACTSSVVRGRTTASGTARWPVRPSHSYIRSSAGSEMTASVPSARSRSATRLTGSAYR